MLHFSVSPALEALNALWSFCLLWCIQIDAYHRAVALAVQSAFPLDPASAFAELQGSELERLLHALVRLREDVFHNMDQLSTAFRTATTTGVIHNSSGLSELEERMFRLVGIPSQLQVCRGPLLSYLCCKAITVWIFGNTFLKLVTAYSLMWVHFVIVNLTCAKAMFAPCNFRPSLGINLKSMLCVGRPLIRSCPKHAVGALVTRIETWWENLRMASFESLCWKPTCCLDYDTNLEGPISRGRRYNHAHCFWFAFGIIQFAPFIHLDNMCSIPQQESILHYSPQWNLKSWNAG